jgi:hypothetical protein
MDRKRTANVRIQVANGFAQRALASSRLARDAANDPKAVSLAVKQDRTPRRLAASTGLMAAHS